MATDDDQTTPLALPPPPPAGGGALVVTRALVFLFIAWTGWDFWRTLLPFSWQARTIARRMLRKSPDWNWHGIDPATQRLVIQTPFGSYEVLDRRGRVRRCSPEKDVR